MFVYHYKCSITSVSVLAMFKEALVKAQLKQVEVEFTRSFVDSEDGLKFLCDHAKANDKLESVRWSNNPVDSLKAINHLLDVIINHPLLRDVDLNQICGEKLNGYDILPSVVSLLDAGGDKSYRICLDSNNIRTNGGTILADVIETNYPNLHRLSLADNHLGDNDIALIADALKQNTNLKNISFGDLSDASRKAASRSEKLSLMMVVSMR